MYTTPITATLIERLRGALAIADDCDRDLSDTALPSVRVMFANMGSDLLNFALSLERNRHRTDGCRDLLADDGSLLDEDDVMTDTQRARCADLQRRDKAVDILSWWAETPKALDDSDLAALVAADGLLGTLFLTHVPVTSRQPLVGRARRALDLFALTARDLSEARQGSRARFMDLMIADVIDIILGLEENRTPEDFRYLVDDQGSILFSEDPSKDFPQTPAQAARYQALYNLEYAANAIKDWLCGRLTPSDSRPLTHTELLASLIETVARVNGPVAEWMASREMPASA